MPNKIVTMESSNDGLQHYGVIGMKWGVRRASRKTSSLGKKVSGTIRRYDKGKKVDREEFSKLSAQVRKQRFSVDKKIRRAQKFLDKSASASAKNIINRYNKDPAKQAAVKDFLESMKLNASTLTELRDQLIDVRV